MSDLVKKEEKKFTDLVSFVNAQSDDDVVSKKCKLCNSAKKAEAELMAENGTSVRQVHQWLLSQGEDISYCAVNSHFSNHFGEKRNRSNLNELAVKLSRWTQVAQTDDVLFARYINFLDMEAMTLASENSSLSIQERRKNDELILKIAQTISLYKEQQHKLQSELRPVEVVIQTLNRIIQFKLEGTNNPDVKKVLTDIIEQLIKEVGDFHLDEGKND